ncbi:MAG: rhomboid family intramembrane serine protease [Verrucomicrobia bacterium]|nr:rhomboid family intramembrane serine protease [Verrucomicrobiota bacterium]
MATITVLVVTGIFTLIAFQKPHLLEKWIFDPRAILVNKDYYRMYTSGLIHANWMHFAVNAISFYSFAQVIERHYGPSTMLLIYGSSVLGGSLLSLIVHRNHEYRALGASGGVCGIIFASIFLIPGTSVMIFFVPIPIPAYLYAVIFLIYSFIGQRRGIGRVGHDAHLGGAIIGLLVATGLYPDTVLSQPRMFAAVLSLSVLILLVLILDPLHLIERRKDEGAEKTGDERERRYAENAEQNAGKLELDALLEKISENGLSSLSDKERARLEELSKEIRERR